METFWIHWKNKKNIYPDETKRWHMAKIYIQCINKYFCIDLKQKETDLLIEYRAEIDSLSTNNAPLITHKLMKPKTK